MMNLTDLVPPLDLCKLIPEGEFQDSALVFACQTDDDDGEEFNVFTRDMIEHLNKRFGGTPYTIYPAPTLQEILEELHKYEEDVYVKWSETAYHEWLINAYTQNSDFQEHDRNIVTAALKLWLKMKGIYHE